MRADTRAIDSLSQSVIMISDGFDKDGSYLFIDKLRFKCHSSINVKAEEDLRINEGVGDVQGRIAFISQSRVNNYQENRDSSLRGDYWWIEWQWAVIIGELWIDIRLPLDKCVDLCTKGRSCLFGFALMFINFSFASSSLVLMLFDRHEHTSDDPFLSLFSCRMSKISRKRHIHSRTCYPYILCLIEFASSNAN